MVNPEDGY